VKAWKVRLQILHCSIELMSNFKSPTNNISAVEMKIYTTIINIRPLHLNTQHIVLVPNDAL
jgi:hypothetical protein